MFINVVFYNASMNNMVQFNNSIYILSFPSVFDLLTLKNGVAMITFTDGIYFDKVDVFQIRERRVFF